MEINIKPQVTQQTFQMKWTQRKVYQKTLTQILLNNGNRLAIRETPYYKLQTVYNKCGEWIKSKLRYYKGRQVIKEMRSYNNANQMD